MCRQTIVREAEESSTSSPPPFLPLLPPLLFFPPRLLTSFLSLCSAPPIINGLPAFHRIVLVSFSVFGCRRSASRLFLSSLSLSLSLTLSFPSCTLSTWKESQFHPLPSLVLCISLPSSSKGGKPVATESRRRGMRRVSTRCPRPRFHVSFPESMRPRSLDLSTV